MLKFEHHSKELNFRSPSAPLLTDQVQNIFKRYKIWGLITPPPGPHLVDILFILFHITITNQETNL